MQEFQYLTSDLEALAGLRNYYRWIFSEIRPFLGGRIAEVGAGIGTFTRVLLDNHVTASTEARLDAFEPARNLYHSLVTTLERGHRPVMDADRLVTHNLSFTSAPGQYDTVIMINVLEHIEDDVGFVRTVREALAPSGRFIIFVPAGPWLYSELDRSVGHYRRYTRATIDGLMRKSEFDILKTQYMDVLGVVPWYLVHVLGKSRHINPTMARLYDRVCIPLTRGLERVWTPAFGKNLLLVGEKTGTGGRRASPPPTMASHAV
jgi:SAM-dependent methyltransferase